jgi:hypothetical protein
VARGRLQACPSFEASAAAASSALGSTRNFGRDSGRMTGKPDEKRRWGDGVWIVYETRPLHSNFDFFRFTSHLSL